MDMVEILENDFLKIIPIKTRGKEIITKLKKLNLVPKNEKLTKCSIHLETGGMTSKKLGHSYSYKKGNIRKIC